MVVGAVYEFPKEALVDSPSTFFQPLRRCIETCPHLCVVVRDAHTEKPFFDRVPHIDLEDHVSIVKNNSPSEELLAIENALAAILDEPFPSGIPPWKIVVLPLQSSRCFVAFAYSHAIGDGPTGAALHRKFLTACNDSSRMNIPAMQVVKTPDMQLPGPFDTAERLPISWVYLLAPLIISLLPTLITKLFGLQATVSTTNANTWTGSLISNDPQGSRNMIKVREIDAVHLEKALVMAREHDAKLTGTLHQLIVRALSKTIPNPNITNFVSQTPINMRRSIGISNEEMGNFYSGNYMVYPRLDSSTPFSQESWESARLATRKLAESASTLQDQPIGLLRYLPSIRKWTLEKLGRERDCSFELSNIGTVDGSQRDTFNVDESHQIRLMKMVFAQPGHITGPPLCFNIVSVRGGSLVYTITWQVGALGVPDGDEERFVDDICSTLATDFENIQ